MTLSTVFAASPAKRRAQRLRRAARRGPLKVGRRRFAGLERLLERGSATVRQWAGEAKTPTRDAVHRIADRRR